MLAQATDRGFPRLDFTDRYGVPCSLQESSLATEAAIWFGPNEAGTEYCVPGKGWMPFEYPEGLDLVHHTRAHITQRQMKDLLPVMEHFVKHGELPEIENGVFITQRERWRLAVNEMYGWRLAAWMVVCGLLGIAFGQLDIIGAI